MSSARPEYRKLPPRVTTIACTRQYAIKKPESAPQATTRTKATPTAPQIGRPKSCQPTPMVMDVRPTRDATWMSMPPVTITSVTKSEIIKTGRLSLMLVNSSAGRKNLPFAAPKITNSSTSRPIRIMFQLVWPLDKNPLSVFIISEHRPSYLKGSKLPHQSLQSALQEPQKLSLEKHVRSDERVCSEQWSGAEAERPQRQ